MNERIRFENDQLSIEVALIGAELKSLKCENIEYIWKGNPKYWNRSAPFLFPIVGTLKDKQTIINGKMYDIMQHGFLRDQLFEVYHQTKTEISFISVYSDETLKLYPFKYKAIITYKIKDKSLTTKISIYNEDIVDMPFNLGGHPGFNCPFYPNEKFDDYTIRFQNPESFKSPEVTTEATLDFSKTAFFGQEMEALQLEKKIFSIDTIIIPRVKSKAVELVNKENKGIRFEYPKFKTLAIWTPFNDAPFVCLEPWNGYNDRHDTDKDFLKKDNIIVLKPIEHKTFDYTITILN